MKTYTLSCKDMGVAACDYVAVGETREEVVKMASEHGIKVHPKEMKEYMSKMSKDEMEQSMLDRVVEEDELGGM